MTCPHVDSISGGILLTTPTPAQSVYREDCTQCFDSIDDPTGLDVCLQCFNGACTGDKHHTNLHHLLRNHPLVLNIRRSRKSVQRDEPPPKMSKLAIAAETEEDRYHTALAVKCLECNIELDKTNPRLAPIINAIMKANTFSRKEEVKAWEQELTTCHHVTSIQQGESRKVETGNCYACHLTENLWLCLECGNLGCGRKQLGGVDGNSHALAHSNEAGHGVAVKLGSITPEGTADIYCYKCDEERLDTNLGEHLSHWGIELAGQQKTEKSLTEMQIEQNMKWDFSMTTEDGKELKPIYGRGLTGLKNLGNSCYLASVVQCLFDTAPFQNRYFRPADDLPIVDDPAEDLETQLRKIADGLLSGRYSKLDIDVYTNVPVGHQKGLAPAMFKHLIGRGHEEFSTMRQQDALELLQHLFKLITRTQHPGDLQDPTQPFRFQLEQRLQCLRCHKVRYSTTEQDSVFFDVPLEKLPKEQGSDGPDAYKSVTLQQCLENFTGAEKVDLTCSECGSKDGFTKQSLFKTFPEIFVVNARKMTMNGWVPIKVDVPVIVPDESFLMDAYLSKGPQPSEQLLPDEPETQAPAFVPFPTALALLEEMGFPKNRAERALHATGNLDANAAMMWAIEHEGDADIDEPLKVEATAATSTIDPGLIETLGMFGIPAPNARRALKETGGDVERAAEWFYSHPDEPGLSENEAAEESGPIGPKEPAGSATLPASFQLQSIVCHKGTSIHAGHYVAFIRKIVEGSDNATPRWVLFNDEKVVLANEVEEMSKFAYLYFFKRV